MSGRTVTPDIKNAARMRELCAAFDQGRLIAMPTETVYGLAAPINRPDLVEKIFQLKGRPASNPLIVHVCSIEQARDCVAGWPMVADALAKAFWPGPLTLVLPRSDLISDRVTAGQPTVALRMPDHPVALALIEALDSPVVAPSANLFTRLSPTTAADVAEVFDDASVLVLDGGPCQVGIESSIVSLDEAAKTVWWLRPGQIDRDAIRPHLPAEWRLASPPDGKARQQRAPGDMLVHYRPAKPMRVTVAGDMNLIEQTKSSLMANRETCLVEISDEPDQAARDLYASLRKADAQPGRFIDVVIPARWQNDVAWEGVLNRLRKSASAWNEAET
ncbi:MAG: L-threonylcarbamoyladenylate synthase [Wenzhouxiangella sp.]|jgi:L-threonylcarbamoyladenylate synthase|nr:L-threonylcarbamoyladenylate synthase [Wenzhouxiangella sp.]